MLQKYSIQADRWVGKDLDLPARSRFGEGRAETFKQSLTSTMRDLQDFPSVEVEGAPENVNKDRVLRLCKPTCPPVLCNCRANYG
jgi:hypothetical protein